jgi:hypothetical protein
MDSTQIFSSQWNGKRRMPPSILGIDIYKKTESSLGHKLYQVVTHTNLYLHWDSHYHPANEQSVLASIHRAKARCDQDSLTQELEFLTTIFKDIGYSPQQKRQAFKPATHTTNTNEKPASIAFIPYTHKTNGRLSRMLAKRNITSVSLSPRKNL